MEQILCWSQHYRFIGGMKESRTHITTMDQVQLWVNSYATGDDITSLCGHRFRPTWSGLMLLDTDILCATCERKFDEMNR